jgi:hypothetical protein
MPKIQTRNSSRSGNNNNDPGFMLGNFQNNLHGHFQLQDSIFQQLHS